MSLFKDMLSGDESVFVNEIALDFDYVPYMINYRENQLQYVATCIKPLFSDRTGKNLLITGKPGIGKTMAIKHIFSELKKETDHIITIFINCWKKDTFYKIMLDICGQLNYKWTHNKKSDELFKEVSKLLNKKTVVFCFDEVDKLDDAAVLYSVLEDINKKTILLITNEKDWLASLDERVRSRLMPEILEFKPYTYDETFGILEQRKDEAFVKDIWDNDSFEIVVDKTAEFKDIRTGLFLLREAGNAAEHKSSRKITKEHAQTAVSRLTDFNKKELDEDEEYILSLVKENPDRPSMEIYNIFKQKYDKSYRTFQRKVKILEDLGSVIVKEDRSDTGGKISILNLKDKKLSEF